MMNKGVLIAAALCVALGPVYAASVKSIMRSMADTTKSAKVLLSSYDAGKADAALKAYADEARSAADDAGQGGGAKAEDLRSRFAQLAATADDARRQGGDKAAFRHAFGAIVAECRSCHSAYK